MKKIFSKFIRSFNYRIRPLETFPQSPDYFGTYRSFTKNKDLTRWAGGWIYRGKKYPDYLFLGGAAFAIFNKAKEFLSGKGVDIGAGYWVFPGAIPIDLKRGEGLTNNIGDFKDESLDYIFSSHCLEHISNWKEELANWIKKIRTGGMLFLYLPHPDCEIWHPNAPGIGDGHKWIPNCDILTEYFSNKQFKIKYLDKGPDAMMSFSICVEKLN